MIYEFMILWVSNSPGLIWAAPEIHAHLAGWSTIASLRAVWIAADCWIVLWLSAWGDRAG